MNWKSYRDGIEYSGKRKFFILYQDLWRSTKEDWEKEFKKNLMPDEDLVAFKKFYDIKFSQGRVK